MGASQLPQGLGWNRTETLREWNWNFKSQESYYVNFYGFTIWKNFFDDIIFVRGGGVVSRSHTLSHWKRGCGYAIARGGAHTAERLLFVQLS